MNPSSNDTKTLVTTNIPVPSCCQNAPPGQNVSTGSVPLSNILTIPIIHNEANYTYVAVKGSLHDFSTTVFGLNEVETQALTKRYERLERSVKTVPNGVMVSVPLLSLVNTLAELNYKVVCCSGEGDICFTMEREI